jgi:predicted nuclease with TOPRIM domain
MTDARTPRHYFQDRDAQVREALNRVKGRLEELTQRLQELKAQRATTKAHQQIKDKEIESVEKQQYRKRSKRFAMDAVDQIATGDRADAVEAIKECLDHKAFVRSEPHLDRVGQGIKGQVFR